MRASPSARLWSIEPAARRVSPSIRAAAPEDADILWSLLRPVFRAGDTYAVPRDITREAALAVWSPPGARVFLAETDRPAGTFYVKPNQSGGGAHVCNAGFVTAPEARGQGLATAMLDHALDVARAAGFHAMQFNFVVTTNAGAIRLWRRAGFATVGRLPRAFRHPTEGFVDALVMFKTLTEEA